MVKTTMQVPANFTQLLTEWGSGHPDALTRLTPLVYDELRKLARSYMRAERGSHTLQATGGGARSLSEIDPGECCFAGSRPIFLHWPPVSCDAYWSIMQSLARA